MFKNNFSFSINEYFHVIKKEAKYISLFFLHKTRWFGGQYMLEHFQTTSDDVEST